MQVEDIPENTFLKKKQINYDDILRNMGMREVKGKLFWEKNNVVSEDNFVPYEPGERRKKTQQPKSGRNVLQQPTTTFQPNTSQATTTSQPNYQNSYIHNKYFKNELKEQPDIQKPRNLIEYRNMLIRQIIERKRVEQIKSRQMCFK